MIVANDFRIGAVIDHSNEGILDLAEVLPILFGIVNRHDKGQLLNRRISTGNGAKVKLNCRIITVAFARSIVSHVLNRAIDCSQVVVEDKILLVSRLTTFIEQENRGIKVELRAIGDT